MTTKQWIWQQESWPNFTWSEVAVGPLLRETAKLQGALLGKTDAIPQKGSAESNLDALLQNIVETSAIEVKTSTLKAALNLIELVLAKARFWQTHAEDGLTPQQTKVLNRLMDAGPKGFVKRPDGARSTSYDINWAT